MGFDITYHPISIEEMNKWFFEPIEALNNGDDSVLKRAIESQSDDFYAEKYEFILKDIASRYTEFPSEKGLLYAMANCIGLFHKYQYVRGSAFSFLIEREAVMDKYHTPWKDVIPDWVPEPESDLIAENYSSGIFIGPDRVKELLADNQSDENVHSILLNFFGERNLEVFLKALNDAADTNSGLIEAAEVMEVNPFELNQSSCYSDIRNCDPEGAFIYQDVAMEQVKDATGMNADEIAQKVVYQKTDIDIPDSKEKNEKASEPKKGILSRLFKKK